MIIYLSAILPNLSLFSAALPDFVIGFDLVGQEDIGKPLLFFADFLSIAPSSAKFFFHAGETSKFS